MQTITPAGPPGVIVCNPPYGERLGEARQLKSLYQQLGDVLKQRCAGYTAYVFTGNLQLDEAIGLKPDSRVTLYNGPIRCQLLKYKIF